MSSEPTSRDTPGEDETPISKRKASGVLVASAVSAVASLLITVIAARALPDPAGYAEFLVFWAMYFGIIGVIAGTQSESTRAVSAASLLPAEQRTGARVMHAAWLLGTLAAATVTATAPWWRPTFLPDSSWWVVAVVGLGVLFSAGHFTMVGSLTGLKHWGSYAWLFGGEGAARLILVCALGLGMAGQLLGMQAATALPALVWLVFAFGTGPGRAAHAARADVGIRRLLRNSLLAMASSASWAALVTGYPALLRVTGAGEDPALLAGTILGITLTRAPIMIPLQALQGVAINQFTRSRGRNLAILFKPMAAVAIIGLVGAGLATLIGPWLVEVFYGAQYAVSGWTLGLLTLAAVGMASLVLTGAATLGISAHGAYTAGWFLAAVSAFAVSLLPLGLPVRAIVALFTGPAVGLTVHLTRLVRHRNRIRAATD